jgi:hypothetical protein
MENKLMPGRIFCYTKAHEEALRDIAELEGLIPNREGETAFRNQIFENIEQLQDSSPYVPHAASARKIVAQFGDACFFCNKRGDLCFLTDFLTE